MPATVLVVVIPEVPPTFGANELGDHIFANHSTFGQDALVAGSDLIDTVFASVSTFGLDRLVESAFPDVSLIDAIFSNVSTFGADTLSAAPPGEILRDTVLTNVSTFGADTLAEAPPGEILRDTVLTNVSTFGADELVSIGGLLVAAGAGSFTITGTAVSTLHGWRVTASAGSFALTGTSATPKQTGKVAAGAGSFALTGTATTLHKGYTVSASAGSYALTGTAASTILAAGGPSSVGIGLIRPKRTGLYKRPGIYRPLVRPRGAVTCFMLDGMISYEPHELYSGRRSTFNGTGSDLRLFPTAIGVGKPSSGSYFSIQSQQPAICSIEAIIIYNSPAGGICGLNEGTTSTTTYDRWLYINTSGQPVFHIYDGAVKKAIGSALTAGRAYHLCGTSDGSNIRLYVDGQLVATTATANGGYVAYTNPCFMVQHGHVTPDSSTTFGGSIHFAQFANVVWSAAEVRERASDPYAHAYTSDDWLRAFTSQGS